MYRLNPRSKKLSVITVDGKQYEAIYCGKGKFSKVFRVGNRVVYYTRGDCGKEALAMYQYDRMAHLPEIIRHDNINSSRGTEWYVFSSPIYRDVRAKDKSAWELMKAVQYSTRRFHQALYLRGERGIYLMQAQVNSMRQYKVVPNSILKAMQEIVDVASNCGGNPNFDLHRGNFGVNEYGTLIFRDPFFVQE